MWITSTQLEHTLDVIAINIEHLFGFLWNNPIIEAHIPILYTTLLYIHNLFHRFMVSRMGVIYSIVRYRRKQNIQSAVKDIRQAITPSPIVSPVCVTTSTRTFDIINNEGLREIRTSRELTRRSINNTRASGGYRASDGYNKKSSNDTPHSTLTPTTSPEKDHELIENLEQLFLQSGSSYK